MKWNGPDDQGSRAKYFSPPQPASDPIGNTGSFPEGKVIRYEDDNPHPPMVTLPYIFMEQ
jgi:hypothetical protein